MTVNAMDVSEAAHLVAYALRPKYLPTRDDAYLELVRRFRNDDTFADLVTAVCLGLELVVLDVNDRHGVVVGSAEDGIFSVRITECSKLTAGKDGAHERVLHALGHLGVATLAYPCPATAMF